MDKEQQWAEQLRRQRSQLKLQQQVPLAQKEKNLQEETSYLKERIQQAVAEQNQAQIIFFLKKLIRLRGKQSRQRLDNYAEKYTTPDKETILEEITDFLNSCHRFLSQVNPSSHG